MAKRKILYATDFSPSSHHALSFATSLAKDTGAVLLIVHVSELEEYPVGELFEDMPEPEPFPPELEKLQAIRPTDPDVPYEHKMLYGEPAEALVKLAQQEHVEMIVMGTHGYSTLAHLLAGSVAENVIRSAPCPVVAVKLPQQQPASSRETPLQSR